MRKLLLSVLFSLLCFSVNGATLEFAFQLGEKQNPQLDTLLPNVVSRLTFNKDSTKLIAHEMGGTIAEWDLQKRQKRVICNIEPDQWSAYTLRLNYLLTPKSDNGISVVNVAHGDEIQLVKMGVRHRPVNLEDELNGQYTSGGFSQDGQFILLTEGDNEIELWNFAQGSINNSVCGKIRTSAMIYNAKLKFKTQLPVRNGIAFSPTGRFIATAEGTYRDGEGHRTIIEIWSLHKNQPIHVFNIGEILGVWNVIFSDPGGWLLATDTQRNGKSGIRVWDLEGRQLLNKSGFEAYWTRALAFAPINKGLTANEMDANLNTNGYHRMYYLASGDEKGNLRIWGIPYHRAEILETESVIWETYPTGIQALAFSPNGEYLAVALWDATIQILRWKNDENNN